MEPNNNDLKKLIGKKVQINYISPASEEATAAGRLVEVTNELIVIDGAVMKTQLARKHMKIVSVDYIEEAEAHAVMKLIISKTKTKMTVDDWKIIGEMIEQGQTSGKNKPKGVTWELVTWM
jgi:RNase P/RNase MRP subunit p29